MKMLEKRNYKIFKSDQGYLFFKGKGIQEHLGYQLTSLLLQKRRSFDQATLGNINSIKKY